jgi:hypothetical protein
LIQGFVADQFDAPISGIQVELSDLGKKAVTNSDGSFDFGFGEPAEQAVPGGRHNLLVNPGLKNRAFGSAERWISVEEGNLNSAGVTPIPILDPNQPFRRVVSGDSQVMLAGGALILDLSNATVFFPDGNSQGDVQAQAIIAQQFAYPIVNPFAPQWAYALQPAGVEVSGAAGLSFAIPQLNGSYDYVQSLPSLVFLVGLDPVSLQLLPVGVGRIDTSSMRVVSQGPVNLKRLDYLGYAPAHANTQDILQSYVNHEISLQQMIGQVLAKW